MIFEVDTLKKLNKYTSVVYKLMLHNFHLPLKCKITHKIKKVLISQSFKNPLNCQILTQPINVQSSGEKLAPDINR